MTFDASGINYQFHFVDSFEARMGNFTLADWAAYMEALNGNISSGLYNTYMDNHVGLHVTDMRPYLSGYGATTCRTLRGRRISMIRVATSSSSCPAMASLSSSRVVRRAAARTMCIRLVGTCASLVR